MTERLTVESTDFWVKVVEMLQQNWALIETVSSEQVRISFINDAGAVFDQILCSSFDEACASLTRNGFERLAESERLRHLLIPPPPPFIRGAHPNGPIYSSGRYWR